MLSVDAAVSAESTGLRFRVEGTGRVLTCRIDGNTSGWLESLRRSAYYLATLRAIVPVLIRTGLRIDFVAGKVQLASIGTGVRQNALGRLLRLPNTIVGK